MSAAIVKGWCPTAWRPMMAGDGLLVRVRPRLGRLTRHQALGLCETAGRYGNGLIDATSRAGLQLRGMREADWEALTEALLDLGLVDPDPVREARATILVAPEWSAGDDTHRIAEALYARLAELPDLPGKMGFAIDAGVTLTLRDSPADFRVERAESGGLLLRGEGRDFGAPLAFGAEVDGMIALARWFVESGGAGSGRMARHAAPLPGWANATTASAEVGPRALPGRHPLGMALGLPFGRTTASALMRVLAADPDVAGIRLTPWHVMICETDTKLVADPADFITDPTSPLLRVDACLGAPSCLQSTVETRDLGRRLAGHVVGRLHVSGCAKGCARAAPADVVLTGRDGRYDLAFRGRAGGSPVSADLSAAQVLAHFGAS